MFEGALNMPLLKNMAVVRCGKRTPFNIFHHISSNTQKILRRSCLNQIFLFMSHTEGNEITEEPECQPITYQSWSTLKVINIFAPSNYEYYGWVNCLCGCGSYFITFSMTHGKENQLQGRPSKDFLIPCRHPSSNEISEDLKARWCKY